MGASLWDTEKGARIGKAFQHDNRATSFGFTYDGHWIWAASGGWVYLWPLPPRLECAPDWLPRLAEVVAGLQLDGRGGYAVNSATNAIVPFPMPHSVNSGDPGALWLRWFLSDPAMRTISPWFELTLPDYVQRLIEHNSLESLSAAASLSPTNGLIYARLALAYCTASTNQSDHAQADFFSRYALKLAPGSDDVRNVRSQILEWAGRRDEARHLVKQAEPERTNEAPRE